MRKPTRPTPQEIKEYRNQHGCSLSTVRTILMMRYKNEYKAYLLELCKDPESNLEEILLGIIELT